MTQNSSSKEPKTAFNPIDVVEDVAMGHDWTYQRVNSEEIILDLEARWSEFRLQFFWHKDFQMMHIACLIEMNIDKKIEKEIFELIACLNYRLIIGHFEFAEENRLVAYRVTQYYDPPRMAKAAVFEDLIDFALTEIDRFFPAFQFVALGDKSAQDAMSVALLDTMGEA